MDMTQEQLNNLYVKYSELEARVRKLERAKTPGFNVVKKKEEKTNGMVSK